MTNSKHGLMIYSYPEWGETINIGDYIQSLAAEQFLPSVDVLVDREGLSDYQGEEVKMIMNGWYMHHPEHWPPSKKIRPLFVAFHLSSLAQEKLLSAEGINYLRKHAPIGCRDSNTVSLLRDRGIESYFSGCLTLTLDEKYKTDVRTDEILFTDPCMESRGRFSKGLQRRGLLSRRNLRLWKEMPLEGKEKPECFYRLYGKLFSREVLEEATFIKHEMPKDYFSSEEEKFAYARRLLARYASARLVVTSRIHCALPCLALGTPVIFINDTLENKGNTCRVEGLSRFFHVINLKGSSFRSEDMDISALSDMQSFSLTNKTDYKKYAGELKTICNKFIESL